MWSFNIYTCSNLVTSSCMQSNVEWPLPVCGNAKHNLTHYVHVRRTHPAGMRVSKRKDSQNVRCLAPANRVQRRSSPLLGCRGCDKFERLQLERYLSVAYISICATFEPQHLPSPLHQPPIAPWLKLPFEAARPVHPPLLRPIAPAHLLYALQLLALQILT